MSKKGRNYDQHAFKVGGSPEPADGITPEREKEYPEPSMFGLLPAYGFFIRHAAGIDLDNVSVSYAHEDQRPAFTLDDVNGASFHRVKAQTPQGRASLHLTNVHDFDVSESPSLNQK